MIKYVKSQISMYVLCPVSDAEILMTLWEDYALQLDDAIDKNILLGSRWCLC